MMGGVRGGWRFAVLAASSVLAVTLVACSHAGSTGTPVGSPVEGPGRVFAAVGASETVGMGTDDPIRDAWPKVLWRSALADAAYYDLGIPGATTAEALTLQAPQAVAIAPDVVTVWLNVNDLIAQVPADTYEDQLGELVRQLRRGGQTQVLVATTPDLRSLPVYLACRPAPPADGPVCPVPFRLPPPSQVRAAVDAYNAAIERVVEREGATLVDLGAFGDAPAQHPEYVAEDGFHPSTEGAVAIAQAFATALAPADVVARSPWATPSA
jgi:acyl-CoA thioesterase I